MNQQILRQAGKAAAKGSGIILFPPPQHFILTGRDGRVSIDWTGMPPIPLLEEDFQGMGETGPDYDMVGRGIYKALRLDPDAEFAPQYAQVLREAYPHIVSELGGQIVMLDARDVDAPYLDRKINFLKIMALLDPGKPGLYLEIARTYVDRGSRLSVLNLAVDSWYGAEKFFRKATELNPEDPHTGYEYGEALYVLGRYERAADVWSNILPQMADAEKARVGARVAGILAGKLPLVPPVDYLSAIGVAVEQQQAMQYDEAAAIIEDVLSDPVFVEQFPVQELYHLLGTCYQEMGMTAEAEQAFKRS